MNWRLIVAVHASSDERGIEPLPSATAATISDAIINETAARSGMMARVVARYPAAGATTCRYNCGFWARERNRKIKHGI